MAGNKGPTVFVDSSKHTPKAMAELRQMMRDEDTEDKEMQILQLQKIIAEQSMAALLRDEMVKEYVRIKGNYDRLNADIAAKEKTAKVKH